MKNQVFLILAKIDHIIFKADAYNAIVKNNKDANLVNSEDCRLGKWYRTDGKAIFGKAPSFPKLENPHRRVHDNVLENMRFIKNGDKRVENEDVIIKNFQDMEKASYELYDLFDKLREEVKKSHLS